MGDPKRFNHFSKLIASNFSRDYKVADIAGGKGYLQLALRELGFSQVITYDQRYDSRRVLNIDYRYQLFNEKVNEEFNLLVGMHSDEATDHIVIEASKRQIPFMVVPCCIKPSAVAFWRQHKFKLWVEHLIVLAKMSGTKNIEVLDLKIKGRSTVLFGHNY